MNKINLIICLACSILLYGQPEGEQTQAYMDSIFKPVKYRSIGPFRGGRSVCASGVIGDPTTYYMGTTGGGLWKTEDAGQIWKNISDGYFKTGSVGAIAVAESNSNILYCGMGEHAPRGVMTHHGDGVYKSIDAGKTWHHMGLKETQHIARIEVHPDNPDIVYVAAQGPLYGRSDQRGIYKSTDGGKTWDKILYVNDRTGCSELSMDMNNPHILYATMWEHQRVPWQVISGGEGSGVYKSVDAGATWKKIEKGLPEEMGKMAIDVCRSNSNKVYCLIESDSEKEKGGLFVSNNAGKSWARISADHRLIQRAWYYIEVFADPNDENTVYVLSAPALRSIDGGKTWSRITGTHGDYHDLWIDPENEKHLCIANDGGAAISFNYGKTWSTQANMPTAQFYRVNVDNLWPYNIYGGQQDNSSVKIAHRSLGGRGITERNWWASAGGESAFLAFDPDNPTHVMGGSYLGNINLLDVEANARTSVLTAPIQYLGLAARDMKYRYNWNAPIIRSMHEPNTYYHAAQLLLRTRDNGVTWEEVSGDLSKADDSKLGKGGGPYTNEAVGAENYGTISNMAESPHEAGTIYVVTDDGHVQLTRDNCETWNNITPDGLGETLINSVDVSPHNPGTAYIATTRYKFNDHKPALYKTTNYGRSWTNITNGIPDGAFTRVVREDDVRKGLLIAGTEIGIYISWNDGARWQPFQLNLPVTPITDLIIRHDDLVVATSGRSFWVFDDMALIRQIGQEGGDLHVYQPEDLTMTNGGSEMNSNSGDGVNALRGVNPANGAVIYYRLPKLADSIHITMEIKDASGKIVRSFSSKKQKGFKRWDGGPGPKTTIDKKEGLNRFVYNLRHESMIGVPNVYIEGGWRGHSIVPGTYSVTLSDGTNSSNQNFTLRSNPLYPTDAATYAEYDEFMTKAEKELVDMHEMVNKLFKKHNQLKSLIDGMEEGAISGKLKKQCTALIKELKDWDSIMVQRLSKAYDDVENFENGFTADMLYLINASDSDIPKVNQPSKDRYTELMGIWAGYKATGEDLLNNKIPALNKALWEQGVGAIR